MAAPKSPLTTSARLATLTAVVLAGWGASPGASATDRHVVHPGESIQKAVDRARPGETVWIAPGTYRESVRITVPRLTLAGSGDRTVLRPGPARSRDACAKAGIGICVVGTRPHALAGVRIRSLAVRGFKKDGIWADYTDRLSIEAVVAGGNGGQGISEERSTRGVFSHDTAEGNGEAGILLANILGKEGPAIDTAGALITHNILKGNSQGVIIRRARHLELFRNDITENCGGVFVVGDENIPRAGYVTIRRNRVYENNKSCPKTRHLPAFGGAGIVITGAADSVVTHNWVHHNSGTAPMSGGIVLYISHFSTPNAHIAVRYNVATDNHPADLANDSGGPGNTFTGNRCRITQHAGKC
jgi:hypothetical protein